MLKTPLEFAQQAQELCVLPDIYAKLTNMLAQDECSLEDLAEFKFENLKLIRLKWFRRIYLRRIQKKMYITEETLPKFWKICHYSLVCTCIQ